MCLERKRKVHGKEETMMSVNSRFAKILIFLLGPIFMGMLMLLQDVHNIVQTNMTLVTIWVMLFVIVYWGYFEKYRTNEGYEIARKNKVLILYTMISENRIYFSKKRIISGSNMLWWDSLLWGIFLL